MPTNLYWKGGDSLLSGLALFDRERTNIEAGYAWAATRLEASKESALAARYANAGANVLSLRLHPRDRIAWGEAALKGCREIGDRQGEGRTLTNMGLAYADLAETRKAIGYYEQALTIGRDIGDRRGEGNALGNLGNAYANLGETRKAIGYHEQILTIAREIGDRQGEGTALGNLGNAYANLGETRKAIAYYEQQLGITRKIGDRHGEGNALANMGLALRATDPELARTNWRQALAIFTAIEDPNAARVTSLLGD
jgi:tetratricopeptide (TPR) repeat protein